MKAVKLEIRTMGQAVAAITSVGAGNVEAMAGRALHLNILLKDVPGETAKKVKTAYNEIGAEAAISSDAYHELPGTVTDMIMMGTVYQHREAARVLKDYLPGEELFKLINDIVQDSLNP